MVKEIIFNLAAVFLVLPAVLGFIIGVACNSRLPQANFPVAINLEYAWN
jgi:hypothetical protein